MQDLGGMQEENNTLMRETLLNSFSLSLEHVVAHPVENAETPVTESSLQSKESPEILTESRLEDEKSEEISKEEIEEKNVSAEANENDSAPAQDESANPKNDAEDKA